MSTIRDGSGAVDVDDSDDSSGAGDCGEGGVDCAVL